MESLQYYPPPHLDRGSVLKVPFLSIFVIPAQVGIQKFVPDYINPDSRFDTDTGKKEQGVPEVRRPSFPLWDGWAGIKILNLPTINKLNINRIYLP